METKVYTASGQELSEVDIKDIQKRTAKETMRNALAAVGAIALGMLAWGFVNDRNSNHGDQLKI